MKLTLAELEIERRVLDHVVEMVVRARERYGIPEGTSGEVACQAMGLQLRWSDLGKRLGMLIPDSKFIVINSTIAWQSRIEFSIYHELVHHIIENDEDTAIDFYTKALRNDPRAYDQAVERWCDAGAAEFLLPRHRVREAITSNGLSVDLIKRLAAEYGSSILATTIQVAINAPIGCYIVVCTHGNSPIWPYPLCLHVEQAARHPSQKYPWARGIAIPDDHLFAQVWSSKQPASGPSKVVFRTKGNMVPCEHGEAEIVGGRVVGILYPKRPPNKEQLTMDLR